MKYTPNYDEQAYEESNLQKILKVDLTDFKDQVFDFYGAQNNQFKLDNSIFEVLEDPEDGYRSCLGCVVLSPEQDTTGFFRTPIARVKIEKHKETDSYGRDFIGWILKDVKDGHVWLTFGTDDVNDYYPSFIFGYEPKEEVNK